jgi:EAL domain-containing protein (putative c-di-GMP-specific phosphodiesterase class I)
VSANGQNILGTEALIRWNHPEKGLIFPDEFIGVAESTGIILDMGPWIIEECAIQIQKWNDLGFTELHVAINLSARQFQDSSLVSFISNIITKYGLDPSKLEFEITESVTMSNMEATLRVLNDLKSIGVTIAIDDFGTGYSSLAYLKKFPIDTLKIDKSFIMDMLDDHEDKVIAQTIISMAHLLGYKTIAEGVETITHAKLLESMGCDQLQGYYFCKPIRKDEFTTYLKS